MITENEWQINNLLSSFFKLATKKTCKPDITGPLSEEPIGEMVGYEIWVG